MEGQFYFMGIAGLAVSLAGFSALLTLFRGSDTWDPVALWRVRTIVRASINTASAALIPVPIFYLTGSTDWAIRVGTALMLVLSVAAALRASPKRQPEAWPEGYSVVPFYVINVVAALAVAVNLVLASLGLLLLLLLLQLGLPAGIFQAVVDEFRPGAGLGGPTGDDGNPADH